MCCLSNINSLDEMIYLCLIIVGGSNKYEFWPSSFDLPSLPGKSTTCSSTVGFGVPGLGYLIDL